jgi:hypothetical protein
MPLLICPAGKSARVLPQAALSSGRKAMRLKSDFARLINVIWVVQSPREKFFPCAVGQIKSKTRAVPPRQEGRMRYRHET